jgi:hypothetical protein
MFREEIIAYSEEPYEKHNTLWQHVEFSLLKRNQQNAYYFHLYYVLIDPYIYFGFM